MKSTGIVRGIDNLGRIVLPKELRNHLKIDTNTKLEIFIEDDIISLRKYSPAGACKFCGNVTSDAISFADMAICKECQAKISAL